MTHVLECQVCERRYPLAALKTGQFFLQTMTCGECYAEMQNAPFEKSCFGKPTTIIRRKKHLGYDPEAEECTKWCPDKFLCRQLVTQK